MRGRNWLCMLVLAMLALALVAGSVPALADEASDLSEGAAAAEETMAPEEEDFPAEMPVTEVVSESVVDVPSDAAGEVPEEADAAEAPEAGESVPLGVAVDEAEPLGGNPYPQYNYYNSASDYQIACTWYAWEQANSRGYTLPGSSWGNAGSWYSNAQGAGYSVGSTARANSIACWSFSNSPSYGHVAYVTGVNSNGSINIVEGGSGWSGNNHGVCSRTVSPGKWWPDLGFIYLSGSGPVTVNFSPWENGSYTFVGETNAAIGQQIDVSGGTATDSGMVLYDNNRNKLAQASNGSYYYRIYFNMNNELGYTLTPATIYQYRFWVVVNGTTYWSGYQSFKTGGKRDIGQATVSSVADQTWTGSAITPSPTVKWNGATLTKGTDYTLSYSNNVNVGTATITVTGKGDYSGTKSMTFKITGPSEMTSGYDRVLPDGIYEINLTNSDFDDGIDSFCHLGIQGYGYPAASNANVIMNDDVAGMYVPRSGWWQLTYSDGFYTITQMGTNMALEAADSSNAGGANVQVNPSNGRSNQKWAISKNGSGYRVEAKANGYSLNATHDENNVVVATDNDSDYQRWSFYVVTRHIGYTDVPSIADQEYNGSEITPRPVVKSIGDSPTEGSDYTLSYSNNVNVGTATITITGKGVYIGSKSVTFNILPRQLVSSDVSNIATITYPGGPAYPNPTVRSNGTTLREGTDYTLSHSGNASVGTATVTVTGRGNYAGTVTKEYEIVPASISTCYFEFTSGGGHNLTVAYTGKPITPDFVVCGTYDHAMTNLVRGRDYTVSYKNNVEPGTATITITGIGNYTGTMTRTFKIAGAAPAVQLIPIYRMYNTKTSEHLWTKSKAEYNACGSGNYRDWRQEGVAWYSPSLKAPSDIFSGTQGDYVYVWRLYDRGRTGDHIYLVAGPEMSDYLSDGWVVDKGAGFWTLRKGATISGKTTIPIYRAYNYRLGRGKHHYTPSTVEYDKICKNNGWKPEGTKFYVIKK